MCFRSRGQTETPRAARAMNQARDAVLSDTNILKKIFEDCSVSQVARSREVSRTLNAAVRVPEVQLEFRTLANCQFVQSLNPQERPPSFAQHLSLDMLSARMVDRQHLIPSLKRCMPVGKVHNLRDIELKGGLWAILSVLQHLKEQQQHVSLQNVREMTIVVDSLDCLPKEPQPDICQLLLSFPGIVKLRLPMRNERLNVLSQLPLLTDLSISINATIWRGQPLSLPRLLRLHLSVRPTSDAMHLHAMLDNAFPDLTHLALTSEFVCFDMDSDDLNTLLQAILPGLRKLQSLHVAATLYKPTLIALTTCCSNLQSLNVTRLGRRGDNAALPVMPSILHLTCDELGAEQIFGQILWAAMQQGLGGQPHCSLFPNLASLDNETWWELEFPDHDAVTSAPSGWDTSINRLPANITALRSYSKYLDFSILDPLAFSSITSLELRVLSEDFLPSLPFPNLQSFTLKKCDDADLQDERATLHAYLAVLPAAAGLHTLSLHGWKIFIETADRITALQHLTHIRLNECTLTPLVLASLCHSHRIVNVCVRKCLGINSEACKGVQLELGHDPARPSAFRVTFDNRNESLFPPFIQ